MGEITLNRNWFDAFDLDRAGPIRWTTTPMLLRAPLRDKQIRWCRPDGRDRSPDDALGLLLLVGAKNPIGHQNGGPCGPGSGLLNRLSVTKTNARIAVRVGINSHFFRGQ